MAYMDEIEVGDGVTVTDLRTGTVHHGKVEELRPDATGGQTSKVIVRYDNGVTVSVGPGFVKLDKGENDA